MQNCIFLDGARVGETGCRSGFVGKRWDDTSPLCFQVQLVAYLPTTGPHFTFFTSALLCPKFHELSLVVWVLPYHCKWWHGASTFWKLHMRPFSVYTLKFLYRKEKANFGPERLQLNPMQIMQLNTTRATCQSISPYLVSCYYLLLLLQAFLPFHQWF